MRHQHVGNGAEKGDRRQIPAKIETRFHLRRIERVGNRRHEQRVAIGGGPRHRFRRDHAAVARAVFDDYGLAETGLHLFADKSRKDIRGRAGPETDHELDGLRGIGLRRNGGCACGRNHRDAQRKARTFQGDD